MAVSLRWGEGALITRPLCWQMPSARGLLDLHRRRRGLLCRSPSGTRGARARPVYPLPLPVGSPTAVPECYIRGRLLQPPGPVSSCEFATRFARSLPARSLKPTGERDAAWRLRGQSTAVVGSAAILPPSGWSAAVWQRFLMLSADFAGSSPTPEPRSFKRPTPFPATIQKSSSMALYVHEIEPRLAKEFAGERRLGHIGTFSARGGLAQLCLFGDELHVSDARRQPGSLARCRDRSGCTRRRPPMPSASS